MLVCQFAFNLLQFAFIFAASSTVFQFASLLAYLYMQQASKLLEAGWMLAAGDKEKSVCFWVEAN